jgi:hypothetical protein
VVAFTYRWQHRALTAFLALYFSALRAVLFARPSSDGLWCNLLAVSARLVGDARMIADISCLVVWLNMLGVSPTLNTP